MLDAGHADVRPRYQNDAWSWSVNTDFEEGLSLSDVLFRVNPEAAQTAPTLAAYAPILGLPGSSVWILPPDEEPGLLFLGLSGGDTGAGVFANDALTLSLTGISGPGEFALYDVNRFGMPNAYFNTRDGISAANDQLVLNSANSHRHFSWAFSAPGDYVLSVVPSGTLTSSGAVVSGPAAEWRFRVVPEPGAAALLLVGAGMLTAAGSSKRKRGLML